MTDAELREIEEHPADLKTRGLLMRLVEEVQRLRTSHVCGEPFIDVVNERDRLIADAEELRVQVREAFSARDEARAEVKKLRELASEILSHVRSGAPVHLPHARALSLHIDEDVVARWGERLNLKPVPMCRPDALEDLFPPASGEGRPT